MPDGPIERLAEFTRLSDLAAAAMSDLKECERDLQWYKVDMAGQYECSTDQTGRKVVDFVGAIVTLRFGLPAVVNAWSPSKSPRVAERDREKLDALGWLSQGRVDRALTAFYSAEYPSSPNGLIPEYHADPNAWHEEMSKLMVWLRQCQL